MPDNFASRPRFRPTIGVCAMMGAIGFGCTPKTGPATLAPETAQTPSGSPAQPHREPEKQWSPTPSTATMSGRVIDVSPALSRTARKNDMAVYSDTISAEHATLRTIVLVNNRDEQATITMMTLQWDTDAMKVRGFDVTATVGLYGNPSVERQLLSDLSGALTDLGRRRR